MTDDLLANSFERMLQQHCQPEQVRAMEDGGAAASLWDEIEQSGFADALTDETNGGAGLSLREVSPVLLLCGQYAVPVPLGETMVVRAALTAAGHDAPPGMIAIAGSASWGQNGGVSCQNLLSGSIADWVVVPRADDAVLLPTKGATIVPSGSYDRLSANMTWDEVPNDGIALEGTHDWRATGAALCALRIAGAMGKVMDMTIAFANDRAQFGRPISKFQAIQQQISLMAEQAYGAKMAAQMGGDADQAWPDPMLAAVAKARTSEAVPIIAAIAHGVHGAIGVTDEFDLQLHTRRLHEWRAAFGTESYWNGKIGTAMMEADSKRTVDFVLEHLSV